jgi:hypothetical protein
VQPVPILIVEHDLDLVLALADRVFTDRLVAKLRYHQSRARVSSSRPTRAMIRSTTGSA